MASGRPGRPAREASQPASERRARAAPAHSAAACARCGRSCTLSSAVPQPNPGRTRSFALSALAPLPTATGQGRAEVTRAPDPGLEDGRVWKVSAALRPPGLGVGPPGPRRRRRTSRKPRLSPPLCRLPSKLTQVAGVPTFPVGAFGENGRGRRALTALLAILRQVARRKTGRGHGKILMLLPHPQPPNRTFAVHPAFCGELSRCWDLLPELRNESQKFLGGRGGEKRDSSLLHPGTLPCACRGGR